MIKLFFILVVPFLLYAENLEELINLALHNKKIDSSLQNLQSVEKAYESTKNGYLPSVTVGATYTDVEHETAGSPNNSTNEYASVSYSLYDGGKKGLTYESYETKIKSEKQNIAYIKNQVSLDVIEHYYNYLTYKSQKIAKEKEIEQLQAQFKRLERFFDAGTTTSDELDKIVSRVQSATVDLQELELQIQTVLHKLEYISGKNVSIDEGSIVKNFIGDIQLRKDIEVLKYNRDELLTQAKIVDTKTNPQLSLENKYTHYDNNYDNKLYESDFDEQNVLMVNLSWKIFDFNSTKKAYESAYKSYLSLKSNYEYEKNRADVDLKLAKKSLEIGNLKIKSAQAGLKAANTTYDFAKAKYENGLIDNIAFLEALTEKFTAISVLEKAKYDLEIKKANVIFHSGKNLEEFIQ
ncbi:MAG: TolC family protein [Aliarcobacter sp.]|nr:TolC family protein [Aliarcobacter sp.]